MKKLILILAVISAIGMSGCSKSCEIDYPTCGTVMSKIYIISSPNYAFPCYRVNVKNECSGNEKQFCIFRDEYERLDEGDYFCVYNAEPW